MPEDMLVLEAVVERYSFDATVLLFGSDEGHVLSR